MSQHEFILNTVKNNPDEAFYIIDLSEVSKAYQRWKINLPNIQPYYAVKCNPDIKILSELYNLGCCFDCASKFEMEQIMKISNDPFKILFAHPCKYPSHLEYAKNTNINLMTFDSEEELLKIQMFHPCAQLLLRLAVDDSHSMCKFNTKFGCKSDKIEYILNKAKELNLFIVGFSFHVGSGCKSAETYYDALRICKDAKNIADKIGFNINMIDIGGGFIAYNCVHDTVSFEDVAVQIRKGQQDFFIDNDIKYIAEPGRFMVQQSHTLILTVISKKKENNKFIYYLNDGIYGSFNCIIFDHQTPEIIPLKLYDNKKLYESQIFGNTCDSIDEISKNVLLPELFLNDYVYVKNFGAYTTSAKSDGFNGFKIIDNIYIDGY